MRKIKIKINFDTPCLSSKSDQEDISRFDKVEDKILVFPYPWFYSAITDAINLLDLKDIKPSSFNVDVHVVCESITILNRSYGRDKYRKHEALPIGTGLTFNLLVANHISDELTREIIETIGKYIGLSPFGHTLGYGRFTVKEFIKFNKENIE